MLDALRWLVETGARFRRLARDGERTAETLVGWHWVAAVVLMLHRVGRAEGDSS